MSLAFPIYLDNQATTRVDPRVVAAMLPFFTEQFGNASSVNHAFGWEAHDAVEAARCSLATGINASHREIIFTSGATESNNLAFRGVVERTRRKGRHLISVSTEHKSVLDPLAKLGKSDLEVTLLPVVQAPSTRAGLLDVGRVVDALRHDTILVSVMLANNEIGAIQPVAEIGAICKQRGVLLHCDATQAVGKLPVDVEQLQVDLLSFSAHKIYGPKGIGALYIRRRMPHVKLESQIVGGGQEEGLRSGTLNVPGIIGFAAALEICLEELTTETVRLRGLRDRLWSGIHQRLADISINGPALTCEDCRLPGNLSVSFVDVDGEALMMSMRDVAVSSGSACTSVNPEPSHVLKALGLGDDLTRSSLRFGLGRFNSAEEIDYVIEVVSETVKRLRQMRSS